MGNLGRCDIDRGAGNSVVAQAACYPKVFTVAAVIPMFPGIYAYTAMISVVKISHLGFSDALFETMVTNFLKASFIVGALSIGLSLPGLWLYRKRPSV